MPQKVTVYPVYMLAGAIDEEPFDRSALPINIAEGVGLEDVSAMLNEETFAWVRSELGKRDLEDLRTVQYALVHRYRTDLLEGGVSDQQSETLVQNLAACLRLIRPMRQCTSLMRGELRENGTLDVQHLEHPVDLMEVPEVQKLFHLRNRDVDLLRAVAKDFLRAMRGEFWKFRMAVDFHQAGHFQDRYWKARYLLWCSAVEAIFTSDHPEHRGSLVAKERIKWFLGTTTSMYDPGDIPNFVPQPNITVSDVMDDMYRVRNFIAHGDRIPDEYFQRTMRQGLNGNVSVLTVLQEAVSFVIRKSLLRMLQDNLLDHFASAAEAEVYFADHNLTLTQIRQSG
jgi:hypothetical protein